MKRLLIATVLASVSIMVAGAPVLAVPAGNMSPATIAESRADGAIVQAQHSWRWSQNRNRHNWRWSQQRRHDWRWSQQRRHNWRWSRGPGRPRVVCWHNRWSRQVCRRRY